MAREDDFEAIMEADATLMNILTGGVHTSGTVGAMGINRDTVSAAFSDGYLLPVALVKQRANIPTADVVDYDAQLTSARQMVEVWLYSDQGSYAAIDAAMARLYVLFQGRVLDDSFEVRLAHAIERERDEGALSGANLSRMDWQVDSILEPAGG